MPPVPVQPVDFSLVDTLVGLASGIVATGLAFIAIGWFLFRYKLIHFGQAKVEVIPAEGATHAFCVEQCPQHAAENQRSLANEKKIDLLFEKQEKFQTHILSISTDLAAIKAGQEQILRELLIKGG